MNKNFKKLFREIDVRVYKKEYSILPSQKWKDFLAIRHLTTYGITEDWSWEVLHEQFEHHKKNTNQTYKDFPSFFFSSIGQRINYRSMRFIFQTLSTNPPKLI